MKIVKSLAIITAVVAIAGGGTYALWSDSASITGNTFSAGTMDIKVDADPDSTKQQWEDTFSVPSDYFVKNFKGDCLLAVGDEELIKIHFHTNQPWEVLEYCSSIGEIYDIVVEDMDRQSRGLKG